MKKSKKSKKTKNRKNKNKNKTKKNNYYFFYFSMKHCPYCESFEPLWIKTTKKYPSINMFNIEREKEPDLMNKLNVKSYPTLILLKNKRKIKYNYDRTPKLIERFLKENKII